MVVLHGDQEARLEHLSHDGLERFDGGDRGVRFDLGRDSAVCSGGGSGWLCEFFRGLDGGLGGRAGGRDEIGYPSVAELQHVAYDEGTVAAKPRLHGADDAPGVQELIDLHPLALVVDDIAMVLDVGVVGDEVLLDEHDEGLFDYLGIELDVVADLGDWETAELEEDGDDFLGGHMSARCFFLERSQWRQ